MDIVLIKLSLTPLSMLAVSLAARRWGSFVGGLLAGMPLTSGPISVYLAFEQGPVFAARAADGALSGTSAVLLSYACYVALSRRLGLASTCALSFLAFVVCALVVLSTHEVTIAILVSLVAIAIMAHLTREIGLSPSGDGLPVWDLPARLSASTAMVLAITTAAPRLGPTLSGVLSPIPVISWPLIVFAHVQGGRADALAAVRGTAAGALGILVFYIVVAHFVVDNGLVVVYGAALGAAALVSAVSAFGLRLHATRPTLRRSGSA